jgi:hypothetical protein
VAFLRRQFLLLIVAGLLGVQARAADGRRFSELGLPAQLDRARLETLLQRFVDASYLKGFRHIGDERDFDHGHLLFGRDGSPVAILYHTQELAWGRSRADAFAYVDPGARNWIQWLSDGRVENAARYLRRTYPATATWDWFRASELPGLESRRTITDKMLEPGLLPLDVTKTRQWVFTRVRCEGPSPRGDAAGLRVLLPTRESVCLALSAA